MNRQRIIIGALALVAVFFAWEFVAKALLYDPYESVQAERETEGAKSLRQPVYKEAWGPEIKGRNLFSESRSYSAPIRPSQRTERPETPAQPKPQKPDIKLSGIIKNQFGEFVAYLKVGKGQSYSVRKGDVTKDITIVDITEREVTIKWMDELSVLTLSNKPLVTR